MTSELRKLLIWIAENTWAEPLSGLLPGGPCWNVRSNDLLDAIAESFAITKEEIGEVVNSAREIKELSDSVPARDAVKRIERN